MSKSRQDYFFLNHQGECSPPNKSEVRNLDLTNKPYMLVPDNNVCIHVSDSDKYRDKTKKIRAKNFLKYVEDSRITVNPSFGLLERASKPGTLSLNIDDLDKFEDTFWRKLNNYSNNRTISSKLESIDVFKNILYPLYAYLLKIKLILLKRKSISKNNAETNLNELYDFIEDMKIYMLIPWQFAVAIFGGHTQLNKFLKPRKNQTIFQAVWGASWDLFYLQWVHQCNGLREFNGIYPRYIFATDDIRCATIGKTLKEVAAIKYGNVIYNQTLVSHDFPHWKQKDGFLREMSQEIDKGIFQRMVRRNNLSEKEFQYELNAIIDNSNKQISNLTQEIKTVTKKGFG